MAIGDLFNTLKTSAGDRLITNSSAGFYSTPPLVTVPEPSTVGLLAFGLLALGVAVRRRREAPTRP